jgi:hypothetical protein
MLAARPAKLIENLVPRNADQPGSLRRTPLIRVAHVQGLQECVLDDSLTAGRDRLGSRGDIVKVDASPWPAL